MGLFFNRGAKNQKKKENLEKQEEKNIYPDESVVQNSGDKDFSKDTEISNDKNFSDDNKVFITSGEYKDLQNELVTSQTPSSDQFGEGQVCKDGSLNSSGRSTDFALSQTKQEDKSFAHSSKSFEDEEDVDKVDMAQASDYIGSGQLKINELENHSDDKSNKDSNSSEEGYISNSPYPEIERKYKNKEELSDEDIDCIADIALAYIKKLLSFFDAEDSVIDEYAGHHGELIFDISNPNLAVLIGRHGKTLEAFQFLVTSHVNKELAFKYPVIVDIEGYKYRRKKKLENLAQSLAQKALDQRRTIKMHPMSAYERRIIHMVLRKNQKIHTYSEGQDPERRVVIQPYKNNKRFN